MGVPQQVSFGVELASPPLRNTCQISPQKPCGTCSTQRFKKAGQLATVFLWKV